MYPTGWKHSSEHSSATTAITEFETGITAPTDMQVICEGFRFCLVTVAVPTGTGASIDLKVWGSQTSGEASQEVQYCFNSRIVTIETSDTDSDTPISIPALPNCDALAHIDSVSIADSGQDDATSSANNIDAIHFWNRVSGHQTVPAHMDTGQAARSGDEADADKLWHYKANTSESGICWFAVPCGPFNYLQFEFSNVGGGTCAVLYNLIA